MLSARLDITSVIGSMFKLDSADLLIHGNAVAFVTCYDAMQHVAESTNCYVVTVNVMICRSVTDVPFGVYSKKIRPSYRGLSISTYPARRHICHTFHHSIYTALQHDQPIIKANSITIYNWKVKQKPLQYNHQLNKRKEESKMTYAEFTQYWQNHSPEWAVSIALALHVSKTQVQLWAMRAKSN
jgi:hypothetical protein